MAPNTKKWDERIQEVYHLLFSMSDFEPSEFVQRELATRLDAMPAAVRKDLSNNLHLTKQKTESWRKPSAVSC